MTDTRALAENNLKFFAERGLELSAATRQLMPEAALEYRTHAAAYFTLIAEAYIAISTENAELKRQLADMDDLVWFYQGGPGMNDGRQGPTLEEHRKRIASRPSDTEKE